MAEQKKNKKSWAKIKADYITGEISQRELSEKYGVSSRQIALHSKNENWVELRKQKHGEISAKVEDDLTQRKARSIADSIRDIDAIGNELIDKLRDAVKDINVANVINIIKSESVDKNGVKTVTVRKEPVGVIEVKAEPKELKALADTALRLKTLFNGSDDMSDKKITVEFYDPEAVADDE